MDAVVTSLHKARFPFSRFIQLNSRLPRLCWATESLLGLAPNVGVGGDLLRLRHARILLRPGPLAMVNLSASAPPFGFAAYAELAVANIPMPIGPPALNPKPLTLNSKPETLNPKP